MDTKKDILWRAYLIFLGVVGFGIAILVKTLQLQQAEGVYWKRLSDSLHLEYRDLDAERGTIYSEDGSMLSTSIPYFDVRVDFAAERMKRAKGKVFYQQVDSLSIMLSELFGDRTAAAYKSELISAFRKRARYHLLQRNITYQQYKLMKDFPLIRKDKDKSGFIFEEKESRLTPYGILANRTIGISRQYVNADGKMIIANVGLELAFDSLLRGEKGRRLFRRLGRNEYVPVEGADIEPEDGKDVLTTLDVTIQEIAENALLRVMQSNESMEGTAIVMEVHTGKIRAIANLGKRNDGSYAEELNYAIRKSEPGSTFKLFTLLSLLEDGFATTQDLVNLENGRWQVGKDFVIDSDPHHGETVTLKKAFALSSNVAMAKFTSSAYGHQPSRFISRLSQLKLNENTGLGLPGESSTLILNPRSKYWNQTSLPWMSFGYNISLTPLHMLMLYNAVANQGKMMKPYVVNAILKDGQPIMTFQPEVKVESICSKTTLNRLRECLEGVMREGTGRALSTTAYRIAGKTGTTLIADGDKGYEAKIYQSSFAGFFPAEDPRFSCIVVIRNKSGANKIYGAEVAGPVFREIADRLHVLYGTSVLAQAGAMQTNDSTVLAWKGYRKDFQTVSEKLHMRFAGQQSKSEWSAITSAKASMVSAPVQMVNTVVPDLTGMGLKDALYLTETLKLQLAVSGTGKVRRQSISAGSPLVNGQTIYVELN